MNHVASEVSVIPIKSINVLNPRTRDKKSFDDLVRSIRNLGLKKPITVRSRGAEFGYDLVCGQGRLEAFLDLGESEIPAIVIDAAESDCLVMSLVENFARRRPSSMELLGAVQALKARGYSAGEISKKIDFSEEYVTSICYLLEHGEDRLIHSVEHGVIPHSIAIEIARANDPDIQMILAKAYETKTLPGRQLLAIRRIVEQRNKIGKSLRGGARQSPKKPASATAVVRAYTKETERQKLIVRQATLAQSRLLFIVAGLRTLLTDKTFVVLLKAQGLLSLPRSIAERVEGSQAPQ